MKKTIIACLVLAIVLVWWGVTALYYPNALVGLFHKGPKAGAQIHVEADDRSGEGLVFDHWNVKTPGVVLDDPNSPSTWFIMPKGAGDIDIEAV